jgi:hypothetical protein
VQPSTSLEFLNGLLMPPSMTPCHRQEPHCSHLTPSLEYVNTIFYSTCVPHIHSLLLKLKSNKDRIFLKMVIFIYIFLEKMCVWHVRIAQLRLLPSIASIIDRIIMMDILASSPSSSEFFRHCGVHYIYGLMNMKHELFF